MSTLQVFHIKRSQIEARLDPHANHPRVQAMRQRLEHGHYPVQHLFQLASFKKTTVTEICAGSIYIGLENIESSAGEYVATNEKESISSAAEFNRGDILFPKLRPYLNKTHLAEFDGICSTEFHVLKPHGVSTDYLATVLRSDILVGLTSCLMTGNTLPRLQTRDIEQLPIPLPPAAAQQRIVDLMRQAYAEKKQLEAQATKLLASVDGAMYAHLGMEYVNRDTSNLTERIFIAQMSELNSSVFNPKTYMPISKRLVMAIKKGKYPITGLHKLIVGRCAGNWGEDEDYQAIAPSQYKKCLVIRGTEFDNEFNLRIASGREKYRMIAILRLNKMAIEEGDILIEKSGGSEDQPVGRVALIEADLLAKHTIGYSNFVEKIKPNKQIIHPAYLFNYLKFLHSIGVTELIQSQTNGIRNLMVQKYLDLPVTVPTMTQQLEIVANIDGLRNQAISLRASAQQKLQQAKQSAEKLILGEA